MSSMTSLMDHAYSAKMSECSGTTDAYKKGDRVYAQFAGYPPWPAQIQKRAAGKEEKYYVYFYGTYDWACLTPQVMFRYTPETAEIYSKLKSSRRFPEFNKAVKEMEANLEFFTKEPTPWAWEEPLAEQPASSVSEAATQGSVITPTPSPSVAVASLPHPLIEIPPSITTARPELPEIASRSEVDKSKIPAELSHGDKIVSSLFKRLEASLLSKLSTATSRVDSPPPAKRIKEEINEDSSPTAVPLATLRDCTVIRAPTKDPASLPRSNTDEASSKTTKVPAPVPVDVESAARVESRVAPSNASVSLGTKNTAAIPLPGIPSPPATVCISRGVESPAPTPAPAPSPPQNDSQPNTSLVTDESSAPVEIKAEFCDKQFLEYLYLYAQQNPERCDVVFVVGPDHVKIRSFRSFLVTASPELRRLFEEKWDRAVAKESEGIPLPDLDPETFKIFLKMLPLPTANITVEAVKELNLTVSQVFDLIGICTTFHMDTMLRVLEEYSKTLLDNFEAFSEHPEFLNTSSQILKTMLSSDNIPVKEIEIFKCAYKWAKHQCSKGGVEETPENIRLVLGDVIHEIRFPLISIMDFGSIVFPTKILTDKEKASIFEYIASIHAGRSSFDAFGPGFKVKPRAKKWSLVRLVEDSQVVSSPPFVCDGSMMANNLFRAPTKFEAVGLGFLGPIDSDTEYVVEVDPLKWVSGSNDTGKWKSCGSMKKHIQAKRCQVFYFMFDEPIVIDRVGNMQFCHLRIDFSLKGKNSQSITSREVFNSEKDGIMFNCRLQQNQLVELLFNKL